MMNHDCFSETFPSWQREVGFQASLSVLVNLIPGAAVFATDRDRKVIYWSRGAEALLGFRSEEALGEHCLKVSRCTQCMGGCGVAEHGRVADVVLEMYRADGSVVAVRKWGQSFTDAAGRFLGTLELLMPAAAEARAAVPLLARSHETEKDFHGLLSRDPGMNTVFQLVRNIAQTDTPVLIRGESGTGKELIARAIHVESPRRQGPFLAINCAAMSPNILESELFGHERGAFTGAVREHKGVFERAHHGTLFLDEVAEIPLELQAKLLRVLQEMTFFRVGGTEAIQVDVRMISATHRALRQLVDQGKFRDDLMYRLRVVPVYLPPLRERRSDVPLLLTRFIDELNERGVRRITAIRPDAMKLLLDYRWPGNIRELKNVLEYAFAVGTGPELTSNDLPPEFRSLPGEPSFQRPAEHNERAALQQALEQSRGHVGKAAAMLGMSRPTFWRKRKQYEL